MTFSSLIIHCNYIIEHDNRQIQTANEICFLTIYNNDKKIKNIFFANFWNTTCPQINPNEQTGSNFPKKKLLS